MQKIILIVGFIVIVGVLGTGEKKFPVSVQDDSLVKDSVEKNHARSLRDAKNKDKKSKRKGGKKNKRKTLKRKEKKQKLKTRRKTKGRKHNKNRRKGMKKGQKIKKKIQTTRKGNRKRGKTSKKGFPKKQRKENRQETCTDFADLTCISNAIEAMEFEKNQIKNFIKQKNRIEKQSELAGNKYKKNGGFSKAASMMLSALGNDSSAPVCADGGNSSSKESLNDATTNYATLSGCGESIKTACTVDKTIVNETFLETCKESFDKIKNESKKCQDIDTSMTEACDCWGNVKKLLEDVKKDKCSAKKTENEVKAAKKVCLDTFIGCKKAEDAAVGLIYTCVKGEVRTLTADGRLE